MGITNVLDQVAASQAAPTSSGTANQAGSSVSPNFDANGVPSSSAPTAVDASIYNPTNVTVDPAKQTVQGQMTGILSQNSPLMQQAATTANDASNSRGLLNSSMAVGAAQNAVIANALPIAQADSSTYNSAAQQNAQAANTAAGAAASAINQTKQFNTSQTTQVSLANLDSATKTGLADIQANYNIIMQANASAGQLYQQAVKNITDITNNNTMDATSKQAAIDQQMNMLSSGMKIFGAMDNMNLGSLLSFNTNGTTGAASNTTPTAAANTTPTSSPPTTPGSFNGQVQAVGGVQYQWISGSVPGIGMGGGTIANPPTSGHWAKI